MMGHDIVREEKGENERKGRNERDKLLFYFLCPVHSTIGGLRNIFYKDRLHNTIDSPYKCYSGYKDHFRNAPFLYLRVNRMSKDGF